MPDRRRVRAGHGGREPEAVEHRRELGAQAREGSAIASATVPCTPVRNSIADACVSELTRSDVSRGHASSTSSMTDASDQRPGRTSMTSSSMPIV